jgi:HSP20 family molecular chaperone IbpA
VKKGFLVCICCVLTLLQNFAGEESKFNWDEEQSAKQSLEKKQIPIQSIPPPSRPWSGQIPIPAPQRPLPPSNWDRTDPFFHMHQRMEEMQRQMEDRFSNFFNNFDSGLSPIDPNSIFEKFRGSFANPGFNTPLRPPDPVGFIQVHEKKNFIIVEMSVESLNLNSYQVEVQGQILRITKKEEVQEDKKKKNSVHRFSILSTSVQSTLLPAPVEPQFSKAIVKGKLIITFKKL